MVQRTLRLNQARIIDISHAIYTNLPPQLIREISEERDVDIGYGSMEERVRLLSQLDTIIPDWKREIVETPLNQLHRLSLIQVYVYAEMAGISANVLYGDRLRKSSLIEVIPALQYCRSPIQPTINAVNVHPIENVTRTLKDFLRMAALGQLPYLDHPTIVFPHTDRDSVQEVILRMVQYPIRIGEEQYLHLRAMNQANLEYAVIKRGVDKIMASILTREELIFILSRGYYPPITEKVASCRARQEKMRRLSSPIKSLLYDLYQIGSDRDQLLELVKLESIHPLEEFIVNFSQIPVLDLAQSLGMIIPPNVNIRTYFLENVLSYRHVASRKEGLEPPNIEAILKQLTLNQGRYFNFPDNRGIESLQSYTDLELFAAFGLYINYSSRADLINRLVQISLPLGLPIGRPDRERQNLFFIPFRRNCRNKETFLFNQTDDPNLFIIAYGNLENYLGYEPDELSSSFQYRDDDFLFLRPENLRSVFLLREIEQLFDLIKLFPEGKELERKIAEGLEEFRNKTDYDREVISHLRTVSVETRNLIRDYLYAIFETGMYMRKWQGPEYPYPIKKRQTEGDFSPDQRTSESITQIRAIFDQISKGSQKLLRQLRVVEYYKEGPQQSKNSIWDYIISVGNGDFCIRMASTKFVGTGYYYLKNFFNETVDHCDISQLDAIF
jgi:hypothetical protein